MGATGPVGAPGPKGEKGDSVSDRPPLRVAGAGGARLSPTRMSLGTRWPPGGRWALSPHPRNGLSPGAREACALGCSRPLWPRPSAPHPAPGILHAQTGGRAPQAGRRVRWPWRMLCPLPGASVPSAPPPPSLTAPLCPALVFPSVTIHREWLPGLCPRPPGPGHPPTLCASLTGTSSSGQLPGAPACDWSSRSPQCLARHGLCSRGSAVNGRSENYRGERAAAQGRVSGAKPRPHQRLGVSAPRGLVRKVGPVSSPVAF